MSTAVTEEQRAIQESIRAWAAGADLMATVRGMETGADGAWDRHWRDLARLGVFGIGLPEDVGGAGGAVADLAAALEQAA